MEQTDTRDTFDLLAEGAMSVPDAIKFTQCGRTALYEAISRGEIKGVVKHGRRTAIAKRGLIDWLATRVRK
jgi:hypothetical protein